MAEATLASPTVPTFYFIGVTTASSSSRRVFPRWMETLGRSEVMLAGIDLPIHADPAVYRRVVAHIKHERWALGALVTTHKIDLLHAAHDLFDELGPYAALTQEVSSIAKREGKLVGRATDPVAGGLSLDAILGERYFECTGGHLFLLGAGGSATALSLHLLRKQDHGDRPPRIVVVNRSAPRLERLQALVQRFDVDINFEFVRNRDPVCNDEIMAQMPPATVVVNATGMGKDIPGSPLTDAGQFPLNGVVWEINYRGELDFMHQALAQQQARNLTVVDGWTYFVHGWSQVIGHVLDVQIDPGLFERLAEMAWEVR